MKKDKDKVVQVSDLDGKFHHVLYEASNSRIMEHTLSDFHKYVKMARMLSVGAKNRAEKSIEEHKAILEAIKKGDADEAERLANLQSEQCCRKCEKFLVCERSFENFWDKCNGKSSYRN